MESLKLPTKFSLEELNLAEPWNKFTFFSRNQEPGETIENYIKELKILSSTCEFETLKDFLIRNRIVGGINSEQIRSKLLQEDKLTLKKCIEIL
jgi:hypothetical protein